MSSVTNCFIHFVAEDGGWYVTKRSFCTEAFTRCSLLRVGDCKHDNYYVEKVEILLVLLIRKKVEKSCFDLTFSKEHNELEEQEVSQEFYVLFCNDTLC